MVYSNFIYNVILEYLPLQHEFYRPGESKR